MVISKKTIIFQGLRGVQNFPGAVQLFPGGPNANFYRNLYYLWLRSCTNCFLCGTSGISI